MVAWFVVLALLAPAQLEERHRVFLQEEAHFLLSTEERARFLELDTAPARDRFIAAFWSRRDRSEHAERLRACDRLFGTRGRFSARGRIYQLLGPPSFRENLTRAGHRIVPSELWHYTGSSVPFLPDAFYLVFFRAGGSGEYRLWDPIADGVGALVPGAEPGVLDLGARFDELARLEPELALAARELVPGGGLSESQSLLASLEAFSDLAARELVLGESVRIAASTRRLASQLVSTVFVDDAGVDELHYALELAPGESRHLGWRLEDGRYRARLTLVGRLLSAAGERERWEDAIELDVTPDEKEALAAARLSFQGRRVVHSQDARFELALVAEAGGAVLGGELRRAPLLARSVRSAERARGLPFQVGGSLVIPYGDDVVREPTLLVVSQTASFPSPDAVTCEVRRDGVLETAPMKVSGPFIVRELALGAPASYHVRVTDGSHAREIRFRTEPPAEPNARDDSRMRVVARERSRPEEGRYRFARALAWTRRGDAERAIAELELATELLPDDVGAHLELARRRYALGRHGEVLEGLEAVATRFPSDVDLWVLMAGAAEALGRRETARAYYETASRLAPSDEAIADALERVRRAR